MKRLVVVVVVVLLVLGVAPLALAHDGGSTTVNTYWTPGGSHEGFSLSDPVATLYTYGGTKYVDWDCDLQEPGESIGWTIQSRSRRKVSGTWSAWTTWINTVSAWQCDSVNGPVAHVATDVMASPATNFQAFEMQLQTVDGGTVWLGTVVSEAPVPAAPALGCAGTFDGVGLTWTHSGITATGFTIQRAVAASGSWADVHSSSGAARSWEDRPQASHLARDYRIRASNGPSAWSNTCTATTSEGSTGEDIPTPEVTDPEPGGDEGESCAVWNLFCHVAKALRWAFVPPESVFDTWADTYEQLQVTPPFSIAIGSVVFIGELIYQVRWRYEAASPEGFCFGGIPGPGDPGEIGEFQTCLGGPLAEMAADHSVLVLWVRMLAGLFMAFGACVKCWNILKVGLSGGAETSSVDLDEGGDPERSASMGTGGSW